MKIFTYYEELNKQQQKEMLKLWEKSWTKAGFQPVILSKKDAESHPMFEEFVENIKHIHSKLMNENIQGYGMSCYLRWLAYANQKESKFYVSDYDVVNNGFEPAEPENILHLMDDACPCFASGTPKLFEGLCRAFVEVSTERLDSIKNECRWYHDQDFLILNCTPHNPGFNDVLKKYQLKLTRNRDSGVGPYLYNQNNTCKVIHVSSHNISIIKEENPELRDDPDLRIKIMSQFA